MNEFSNETSKEANQRNTESTGQHHPASHFRSSIHSASATKYLINLAADQFSSRNYMCSRSRLQFSVEGSLALSNTISQLTCSEPPIHVHDEKLTRKTLKELFQDLNTRQGGDDLELILILSGHGDQNGTKTWFCSFEAQPDVVDLDGDELADLVLLAHPVKVTAIFDFCHAGGVAKDFHKSLSKQIGNNNLLVVSGASYKQLAYEHPALGRGLFTIALHEALVDKRYFSNVRLENSTTHSLLSCDLKRFLVFARERTEQLAYLFASGRNQTPEHLGGGSLELTWSDSVIGPPVAPEVRGALAARIRRLFGWCTAIVFTIGLLSFFLQYHIAVQPNGWIELRPGPAWMSSLLPRLLSSETQLSIAVDDLSSPSPIWEEDRIGRRISLLRGEIGGLVNHKVGNQENWEFRLATELSDEAKRRIDFVNSKLDMATICDVEDVRRDQVRDYQFALEASYLDRTRSCPALYFLQHGPDVAHLYDVEDLQTLINFGLTELSNQAIKTYLAGLALSFKELEDDDQRRRALEVATLLISARSNTGVVNSQDWLAFIQFLEDVAQSRKLSVKPDGVVFPRLAKCSQSWCELSVKLVEYFAAGPEAAGMGNAVGLMMWLMAKDSERQSAEGSATRSWSLPPLLLLARRGELSAKDFSLIIRRFNLVSINNDMFFIDSIWLPRFARAIPLSDEWETQLWSCALRKPDIDFPCSPFDSGLAAQVLSTQGQYLDDKQLALLVESLDSRMKNDREVSLFGSDIKDLACWVPIPPRWISGLERGVDYDVKIAPPRTADPLTGVQVIEVNDVSAAQALAASFKADHGSSPRTRNLLVRYASNHWSYDGLGIIFRALAQKMYDPEGSLEWDLGRSLRSFESDAQARAALLRALLLDRQRDLLQDSLIKDGPSFWRLDAVLAVRKQLAEYRFELDQFCN
ncbi:caspase family protein [Roseibium marinum]|uniref:Peptidase C14 caspase domain-containing protein n=1 Tax=Roseibium marinum TaxID=281252 RepID=A0A2S3UJE5_9HYPH|nr:caspase family protein [Roseibium marinum]POF27771.1 hypothetical protein CLV41_12251 [Roseibium marinum]